MARSSKRRGVKGPQYPSGPPPQTRSSSPASRARKSVGTQPPPPPPTAAGGRAHTPGHVTKRRPSSRTKRAVKKAQTIIGKGQEIAQIVAPRRSGAPEVPTTYEPTRTKSSTKIARVPTSTKVEMKKAVDTMIAKAGLPVSPAAIVGHPVRDESFMSSIPLPVKIGVGVVGTGLAVWGISKLIK